MVRADCVSAENTLQPSGHKDTANPLPTAIAQAMELGYLRGKAEALEQTLGQTIVVDVTAGRAQGAQAAADPAATAAGTPHSADASMS